MHTDDWKLDGTVAITLQWYLLVSLEMFHRLLKSLIGLAPKIYKWSSWVLIVSFCHIQRKQVELAESFIQSMSNYSLGIQGCAIQKKKPI